MKTPNLLIILFAFATNALCAQGTLVFDQESSNDETVFGGALPIQLYSSLGQSFTPSLTAVSFVQLRFLDIDPNNNSGATVVIKLRANSMNGAVIGTSQLVMVDGFSGVASFLFGHQISVTPNSIYFIDASVLSGDTLGIITIGDTYSGGSIFADGFPAIGNDLWFREGIVVPEPTSAALVILGVGLSAWCRSKKTILKPV